MNAMEKVAWTELLVSVVAVVVVSALFPWFGSAAQGGFGILGFLACSLWFVRRRGQSIVVDERDQAIAQQATFLGIHIAWMTTFVTLIVLVLWSSNSDNKAVSTSLLSWLIWIQFAICYGVKGTVSLLAYRRQRLAP